MDIRMRTANLRGLNEGLSAKYLESNQLRPKISGEKLGKYSNRHSEYNQVEDNIYRHVNNASLLSLSFSLIYIYIYIYIYIIA